jgi:hypothetical protein
MDDAPDAVRTCHRIFQGNFMPHALSSSQPAAMPGPSPWRATLSGLCASLVGIGMARFAYTPLLPAIINAHWFPASTATYLGAANLGGYLAGALLGGPMAKRMPAATALRAMMLLATVAFLRVPHRYRFYGFSSGGLHRE